MAQSLQDNLKLAHALLLDMTRLGWLDRVAEDIDPAVINAGCDALTAALAQAKAQDDDPLRRATPRLLDFALLVRHAVHEHTERGAVTTAEVVERLEEALGGTVDWLLDRFVGAAMVTRRKQEADDPERPGLGLLVKLGSIAVHADELLGPGGRGEDRAALLQLLADPEVVAWVKDMGALLPLKR